MKPLLAIWNRGHYGENAVRHGRKYSARQAVRREIRLRLHANPKGKGNRAQRRIRAMWNDPGIIIWPDYAMP